MGHLTPILAISEGGSIQDIFSILKAGAYDYIETIDNTRKYKKKIENLILWNWYIKKHTSAKEAMLRKNQRNIASFSAFWGKITSILGFFTREPNGRFFVVMYW